MFNPVIIEKAQTFNPNRVYYADGYKLYFNNYWILTYQKSDKVPERQIMTDSYPDFLGIIRMLELKPFKHSDTIGEDSIFANEQTENVSSWREAFPLNEELQRQEKEVYNELDKSFSIYEAVNGL